jgi:hypothetical protein
MSLVSTRRAGLERERSHLTHFQLFPHFCISHLNGVRKAWAAPLWTKQFPPPLPPPRPAPRRRRWRRCPREGRRRSQLTRGWCKERPGWVTSPNTSGAFQTSSLMPWTWTVSCFARLNSRVWLIWSLSFRGRAHHSWRAWGILYPILRTETQWPGVHRRKNLLDDDNGELDISLFLCTYCSLISVRLAGKHVAYRTVFLKLPLYFCYNQGIKLLRANRRLCQKCHVNMRWRIVR